MAFLLQLGINDSMVPRTIRALEFLGFVQEDGQPTPLLTQYIEANDEDAQRLMHQAIVRSYAFVLRAINPAEDSRVKILNAFRPMKPQGQWDRMVTLFLGLCRAAGMEVKEAPVDRPGRVGPRESRSVRRPKTDQAHVAPTRLNVGRPISIPQYMRQYLTASSLPAPNLDPTLVAFLNKLQSVKSLDELDAWYSAFKSLFGYVLLTKRQQQEEEDENQADS
jgi:hypothetical protein